MERFYPVGTPGQPWTDKDRRLWFERQAIQRSYRHEVLDKIDAIELIDGAFEVAQYGALSLDRERYPLKVVTIRWHNPSAPWALVSGGVHGYETSGVQGALAFLETAALDYRDRVNLMVAPCVSPWGYEAINRWNPRAVDPNRSFYEGSPSEEAVSLMSLVAGSGLDFAVHVDLHETTDSDEAEFRPAQAARDGHAFEPSEIPDGFYTVGDTANLQPKFQAAIITGVEPITHIAPADANGQIIGADVVQHGVIEYEFRKWGLCAGVTNARFTSTTEVYPDSPAVTDELCNQAQIAAVRSALDFMLG